MDVIDANVVVHSITHGGSNKSIIDFTLPANTIKWTYWIGVGNESRKAIQTDQENFASMGTKFIGSINPLASLAFNLIRITIAM